jgi:hypothetical protein
MSLVQPLPISPERTNQKWLPLSNSWQTTHVHENSLYLNIRLNFGHIFGKHGRKTFATTELWEAYRRRMEARTRTPKPPAIQNLLKKAYRLKQDLDSNPGLTRLAYARKIGMDPSYLNAILNLTRLAVPIQEHILALPPTTSRCAIRDRQWMRLARIRDQKQQVEEFERLKNVSLTS